jgi:AraC family transcriptional regulator of adaptative response/methylated-DNA-[protein]-cysteine methyltransferase
MARRRASGEDVRMAKPHTRSVVRPVDRPAARPESRPMATSVDADLAERLRARLDAGDSGLRALATEFGVTPSRLLRRFRARYGLSPGEYLAERRLGALREQLRNGQSVTDAVYDAGYGSPSRVYADRAARLGMAPARYRAGGAGEAIRWSTVPTVLGLALVAVTARGVCMVELGADADALAARLAAEFPHALRTEVSAGRDAFLAPILAAVAERLAGRPAAIPLDLLGTVFQRRVWEALMRIPPGDTISYAGLAEALQAPRGARAVAAACAHNRVAVIVPCHRVVRGDGGLGGYRWGLPLKRHLLAREGAVVADDAVHA